MSSSRALIAVAAIAALAVAVWIAIFSQGSATTQAELLKELAKVLLQLVLIGVVGVVAKLLLDQYSADRQRREELRDARVTALNSLTESYWQIKKALHIIDAHRSAKSYGEQMRQIIDHRLALQRLSNEIASGRHAFDGQKEIGQALARIDECLAGLIDEWRAQYARLAHLQQGDEAMKRAEDRRVPDEIAKLPALSEARAKDFAMIHSPFERAATPIRTQLHPPHRAPGRRQAPDERGHLAGLPTPDTM